MENDTKTRDILPMGLSLDEQVQMLTYFLEATERKASEIAGKYSIPLYIIQNPQNGMETAIQDFLRTYRGLIS